MQFEEKTLSKNYVFNGKIVSLRNDDVMLPNGKRAKREVIEHCGGSGILCEDNGKILLVKQFRYAYGKDIYEIPAGKLNKGENPEETAKRELEEEAGYVCKKITKLFSVYPTPGYSNEVIYIYKAEQLEKTKTHLDEDEFLCAEWIDISSVKQMIENGEIKDAKTLIALLGYFSNINEKN